ncbi:hypothetical protein K439DRAFT_1638879 [Ramaria rubella]|nr:hypothetical protein K439DRAFT_1638879 [Ramaria rubella]
MPEYWQALKLLDPASTCSSYATWNIAVKEHSPVNIIPGVSVTIFNRSHIQNYIDWVISIVSFAVLSLINADTHSAKIAGLQLPAAVRVGILYVTVLFPILVLLGVSENAHILTSFIFVRTFSYTFSLTIGLTVPTCTHHRALKSRIEGPVVEPCHDGAPAHAAGVRSINCGHMVCAHGDRTHGACVVSDHKGYPNVG